MSSDCRRTTYPRRLPWGGNCQSVGQFQTADFQRTLAESDGQPGVGTGLVSAKARPPTRLLRLYCPRGTRVGRSLEQSG